MGMCESTIGLQALLSRPLTERNLTALHECVLRTALYSSSYQAEWKIRTIEKSRIITANNRHNSVRYPFPQSIAAQSFQLTTSGIVSRTAFIPYIMCPNAVTATIFHSPQEIHTVAGSPFLRPHVFAPGFFSLQNALLLSRHHHCGSSKSFSISVHIKN